jgi:DNA-binding SARP family transcriptional activator
MEFRILGPLDVIEDGRALELGGAKQRALLGILVLNANRVASSDLLIESLWEAQQPENAQKALHVLVSQLRKTLGGERIVTRPPGYVLCVEEGELDLDRFQRLVAEGGAEKLTAALALWRGPPLAEFAYERFAQAEIARLEELREAALEQRIEADLELGRHGDLVGELESLVQEHPLRERLRAQLMLALYRSGRQAEALAAYQAARQALVEELGLEPGRALRELEQKILRQDPALELPPSADAPQPEQPEARRRSGAILAIAGGVVLLAAVAAFAASWHGSSHPVVVVPNSVAAIDATTNRVLADTPVGNSPTTVAVGAGSVWALNSNEQTLSRIDPASRKVIRVIPTTTRASEIAVSADAIWIASTSPTLVVLNPDAPLIANVIPLPGVQNVLISGPGGRVATADGAVWATTNAAVWRVVPPPRRRSVVIQRGCCGPIAVGSESIWVASDFGIDRIDARVGTHQAHIGLPFRPSGIAIESHGVWLTDALTDRVWRVDPRTNALEVSVQVGDHPSAITVGAGAVWVASGDGTVSRINPETDTVTRTIVLGGAPSGIGYGSGTVWVAVD